MQRLVVRRTGAALVTLVLLSILIVLLLELTPSSPGRRIAGPFADPASVAAIDAELGADRPLVTRYVDWVGDALTGDLGQSYAKQRPVREIVGTALWRSAKLALVAALIVVPLSIAGGVLAGLRRGRLADRVVTIVGLGGIAIPEFVSGFLLKYLFSIRWHLLPGNANPPAGASVPTQLRHFLLPSLTLVIVLFGYLARMARAGTIEAAQSDYARTATMKGLDRRRVLSRHVLRNGLVPTITVAATQLGYLIGGLVAVEVAFTYPGIGSLIRQAVVDKDFPLVQSAVLVVGMVFLVVTLLADLLVLALTPRARAT